MENSEAKRPIFMNETKAINMYTCAFEQNASNSTRKYGSQR